MSTLPHDPRPASLGRRHAMAWLALAVLSPAALQAQERALRLEGQSFERRLRLAGAELQLNGVGLRAVAWFKGFVAGLYLGQPAATAAQALSQPGPKRLQLRMLKEVPAKELAKALNKGMLRNTAPDQQPRLEGRLASFAAVIEAAGTVQPGDVIDLDLEPALGTVLRLNGSARGQPVPGEDFYAAMLRSFVGEQPYDTRLKAGLLGGS